MLMLVQKAGIEGLINELKYKVRDFMARYEPEYLYVLVSGGKDSVAAWSIVNDTIRNYVVIYIHIPGQTHADNIETVYRVAEKLDIKDTRRVVVKETRLIRKQLKEAIDSCNLPCLLHIIVFTHRGEDFWKALKRYGYPAPFGIFGKGTRWCCGTFKHRVFNRLPYNGEYNGVPWKFGVDGPKATDSSYRRKVYVSDIMTWEKTRDTYLLLLRTLTDDDVWRILKYYGLYDIVYKQYMKWGRSPNCMFCPMIGMKNALLTILALNDETKKFIASNLRELLPRYKPGTFSYNSITKWLKALGELE